MKKVSKSTMGGAMPNQKPQSVSGQTTPLWQQQLKATALRRKKVKK